MTPLDGKGQPAATVSDEGLKLAGAILGPTLAALITGGALLIQNAANARRERKRAADLLAEDHQRQVASMRAEWAGLFQETLVVALASVTAWEQAPAGAMFGQRGIDAYDEWLVAFRKVQVATARLLMVEQDPWIRTTAGALGTSTEPAPRLDENQNRRAAAAAEAERLNALYGAFQSFTRVVAGIGTNTDLENVVKGLDAGMTSVPAEEKARLLEQVSAHAALGALIRHK